MDLRDRVVAACDDGVWTRDEVAERFGVSVSWVRRLLRRRRERGTYAPLDTRRGRKPVIVGETQRQLERILSKDPDATLEELRERCNVSCSLVTIHNTLRRLGYRHKKSRSEPPNKTGPML